jgi:thiol:disulfide interchange protein DsbD
MTNPPTTSSIKPLSPVKGLFVILIAVILIAGLLQYLRPKEIIAWRSDFPAAQAESRQTGKPILLYFTAAWCGPCQTMRQTTWADGQVKSSVESAYIPVKIDIDHQPDLAFLYRVESIPNIIILDENHNARRQLDFALAPEPFLQWLDGSPPAAQ